MRRPAYHRQEKDYWCGPAVLQMVLSASGVTRTQAALARQAHTTRKNGTSWSSMGSVIRMHGLTVHSRSGTPRALRDAVHSGRPVIVNFIEPSAEDGHFALVTVFHGPHLTLADPWHGARFRMHLRDFLPRWGRRARRMMVVSHP